MKLIPADLGLVEAAIAGDESLAESFGYAVVPGWVTFTEALAFVRDGMSTDPSSVEWGPRFFVGGDPEAVVGWGGFKGPPVDGSVEIGYEIAAAVQGRGLATAAARAMVEKALASPLVEKVVAHTLAQPNASNHILEKLGFEKVAVIEEEGRPIWRYELKR